MRGFSLKIKALLFLFVLSFTALANASLQGPISGKWRGWAYWKYDGDGPKCVAHMIFAETNENFAMTMGDLDCDIVAMSIPERQFTKENGKLLLNGEAVGLYTESTYEWSERYNERTVINVSIKVNGTNIDYVEHWIQDEEKLLYEITGRLFKDSTK